jgi:nicotinamidase-related amidase
MKFDKLKMEKEAGNFVKDVLNKFNNLKEVDLNDLESEKTALVIVDMINGFTREGVLKSDRIESIIDGISNLSKKADKLEKIAFADAHNDKSPEFEMYPSHCVEGSSESEIVKEIKNVGGYKLIKKNSTNGFLEEEFQNWLKDNENIENFIVVGDCTDICVEQFSVTLKAWFNKNNKKSRVIIPFDLVETYDLGEHKGDFMNLFASFMMMGNGIEFVNFKY